MSLRIVIRTINNAAASLSLVDGEGRVLAANRSSVLQSCGSSASLEGNGVSGGGIKTSISGGGVGLPPEVGLSEDIVAKSNGVSIR